VLIELEISLQKLTVRKEGKRVNWELNEGRFHRLMQLFSMSAALIMEVEAMLDDDNSSQPLDSDR